ncbi:aldose 1-epimerase family protein [Flavobacterium hauense]
MNITITNEHLTAIINPQGAELISLKDSNNEYIWEGSPEFWGKHSPILFPIVGTLKDNTYTHDGKQFSMTRHGFARDNRFVVKEHGSRSVTFSFVSDQDTRKQYPFDFELELKYTIREKTLHLDYTVKNTGKIVMPFSIGAHPAFALPGNFEDYSLEFEKEESLISSQLENDLISDKTIEIPSKSGKLNLSYDTFKNDALIFKSLESGYVSIAKNSSPFLKVVFENFPHLGIWTKQEAPFLCIEPWQGYSDAYNASGNLENKEGIIMLEPNKEYNAGFSIQILH